MSFFELIDHPYLYKGVALIVAFILLRDIGRAFYGFWDSLRRPPRRGKPG